MRVLIVDDSAFMRHALSRLLTEAGIEVVGAVGNGELGLDAARTLHPDVITLDVEMPVMDGLSMLRRLMVETPTRVIMLSSLTSAGGAVTFDALEAGAIDFVGKPSGSLSIDIGRVAAELVAKLHAAVAMPEATFLAHRQRAAARHQPAPGPAQAPAARAERSERPRSNIPARRLVVVASSTGGPAALQAFVQGLPPRLGAGMILVQHMPPGFTASLAVRLDAACAMPVAEARPGDVLIEDELVIVPGDVHLIASGGGRLQLVQLPPVNGVRPAADVTMISVAPIWRERLLAVVLTGMGFDGRDGARAVRAHGGTVYAQDEATATIYGMPAAVAQAGLANRVLPLGRVAEAVASWAKSPAGPAAATRSGDPAPALRWTRST